MTGWRLLARLAARDARRDRWRTLLVVVMVALPVTALVAAITMADTMLPSAQERTIGLLGSAQASAEPLSADVADVSAELAELAGRIEPDVTLEPIVHGQVELLLDGVALRIHATDERLEPGALAAGRVVLRHGRAPTGPGEAAVTTELAAGLGLAVGDELTTTGAAALRVVGIAERPESLRARAVHLAPGTIPDGRLAEVLLGTPDGRMPTVAGDDIELVRGYMVWARAESPSPTWRVIASDVFGDQRFSAGERTAAILFAGLAVVEVALIAGAAFAVSVRRRQRELGLLASAGASPRQVRASVMLLGAVTGLAGALLGVALGLGAVFASSPWLDQLAGRRVGGLAIDAAWLAVSAAIGLGAALLGAWLPARGVARLPITVALSGRRPAPTPARRAVLVGLPLVALGALTCLFAGSLRGGSWLDAGTLQPWLFLLGCVMVVLGAGLASQWLLEQFARVAPRLQVGGRLAVREASRFRGRTGPLVTAAMAALAASVSIASVLGSMEATERASYRPSLAPDHLLVSGGGPAAAAAASALSAELGVPAAGILHLDGVVAASTGEWSGVALTPALGTDELAYALGGQAALDAVRAGEAVLAAGNVTGPMTLTVSGDDGAPVTTGGLPVRGLPLGVSGPVLPGWSRLPTALVPPSMAQDAGLLEPGAEPNEYLLRLDRPVDDRTLRHAGAIVRRVAGDEASVAAERGYQSSLTTTRLVAVIVAVLAGIAVLAVAVALAAAESRGDRATLAAVGASGRALRRLAAGRALLLGGLAGVLAVPVGMVPALVVTVGIAHSLSVHLPWVTMAIVAIGVPLATALVTAVVSRLGRADHLVRAA